MARKAHGGVEARRLTVYGFVSGDDRNLPFLSVTRVTVTGVTSRHSLIERESVT